MESIAIQYKFDTHELYLIQGYELNRLAKMSARLRRMSIRIKPRAIMLPTVGVFSEAIESILANSFSLGRRE